MSSTLSTPGSDADTDDNSPTVKPSHHDDIDCVSYHDTDAPSHDMTEKRMFSLTFPMMMMMMLGMMTMTT
jgi:hypothetical protein